MRLTDIARPRYQYHPLRRATLLLVAAAGFWTSQGHAETPPGVKLVPVRFANLKGWKTADLKPPARAFQLSCEKNLSDGQFFARKPLFAGLASDWKPACKKFARLAKPDTNRQLKKFFETAFIPFRVLDRHRPQGLFTGYYEPEVDGSLKRTPVYNIPLYRKPADLVRFSAARRKKAGVPYGRIVKGRAVPYYTRKEIEQGALAGRGLELVWLKSRIDAFFLQIQGSGRVRLPSGDSIRVAYDGKTGLAYTPVGAVLVRQKQMRREDVSMQSIRKWMESHPGKAQKLMWRNKSFVFFRKERVEKTENGPKGAHHVPLTPRASLAVDRRLWMYGMPVWLDIKVVLKPATQPRSWRHLVIAQDTGSAIRGYARGDIFWGSGKTAEFISGHMNSSGAMYVLLPVPLAARLAGAGK